jgi:hypothetical protein
MRTRRQPDQPAPAPLVPTERAAVIASLAIVMGALFVTSYSLALGDPVPHRIDAALVGNPTSHPPTVDAVERVARGSLVFHRSPRSRPRCTRSTTKTSTWPST